METHEQTPTVPPCTRQIDGETYWMDADGRMVPESMVKEVDRLEDALIRELAGWALNERGRLRAGKHKMFDDVQAFVEISGERYGVKHRSKQAADRKPITLYTFDGKYKLVRKFAQLIRFGAGLNDAKALIDDYLNDLTTGAKPELKAFIMDVFEARDGKLDPGRVLSLARYDIQDDRWKRAMDAIRDATKSIGTASYINLYERIGQDQWQLISLDFAGA